MTLPYTGCIVVPMGITDIDQLAVGQHVTLRTGRMWYRVSRLWATDSGYRFAALEGTSNDGRQFTRCVSERDVARGVLRIVQ